MTPIIFFNTSKGFTLIELLVVISIIGVLSTVAMTSLNAAKARARDAKRLADMEQIVNALEIYKSTYGHYPYNTDSTLPLDAAHPLSDGNGGWDLGYLGGESGTDAFIQPLVDAGLFSKVPGDPIGKTSSNTYRYYRYGANTNGCTQAFFVIGITDMETSTRPHAKSPGWRCPGVPTALPTAIPPRNWQTEFDWVTGSFE